MQSDFGLRRFWGFRCHHSKASLNWRSNSMDKNCPEIEPMKELHVEPKFDDVAVFDDVILSFDSQFPGVARFRERAQRNEVVEVNGLGCNEAALEIGMDYAGRRWGFVPGANRPGARFFFAGRQISAQA